MLEQEISGEDAVIYNGQKKPATVSGMLAARVKQRTMALKVQAADVLYQSFRDVYEMNPYAESKQPYPDANRDPKWNLGIEYSLIALANAIRLCVYKPFFTSRFFSLFFLTQEDGVRLRALIDATGAKPEDESHMLAGFLALPTWLSTHLLKPMKGRLVACVCWFVLALLCLYHVFVTHTLHLGLSSWLLLLAVLSSVPTTLGDMRVIPENAAKLLKYLLLIINILVVGTCSLSGPNQYLALLSVCCVFVGLHVFTCLFCYVALIVALFFIHNLQLAGIQRVMEFALTRYAHQAVIIWQCILVLDFICLIGTGQPLRLLICYVINVPFTLAALCIVFARNMPRLMVCLVALGDYAESEEDLPTRSPADLEEIREVQYARYLATVQRA